MSIMEARRRERRQTIARVAARRHADCDARVDVVAVVVVVAAEIVLHPIPTVDEEVIVRVVVPRSVVVVYVFLRGVVVHEEVVVDVAPREQHPHLLHLSD